MIDSAQFQNKFSNKVSLTEPAPLPAKVTSQLKSEPPKLLQQEPLQLSLPNKLQQSEPTQYHQQQQPPKQPKAQFVYYETGIQLGKGKHGPVDLILTPEKQLRALKRI